MSLFLEQERDRQIGLGTFPFSNVFSPVSQEDANSIVKRFIELGGRYIETAPIYPIKHVVLANILKNFSRSDYLLGTKCVLGINDDGEQESSGKSEVIRSQCLSEIKRLGVEFIDILETHVTAEDVSPSEITVALNKLKDEGFVRFIGVSNVSQNDMLSYLSTGKIDFVQNRYSIIHRKEIEDITDICSENGILFNPYQIIERGQLASPSPETGHWREGDLRRSKTEYVGNPYGRVREWVLSDLLPIANEAGLTLEALAIRWVLSKPQVALPVIGATSVKQIEQNMAVGTDVLSDDILLRIDKSFANLLKEIRSVFGVSVEEFRGLT